MHEFPWLNSFNQSRWILRLSIVLSIKPALSTFSYWSKPLSSFSSGSVLLAMAICNLQSQSSGRFPQKVDYLIHKVSSYPSLLYCSILLSCISLFKIIFYLFLKSVSLHLPFQAGKKVCKVLSTLLCSVANSAGQHDGRGRQQDWGWGYSQWGRY